jgi:hypothetical protein
MLSTLSGNRVPQIGEGGGWVVVVGCLVIGIGCRGDTDLPISQTLLIRELLLLELPVLPQLIGGTLTVTCVKDG